jgi:hypothetical protein
MFAPLDSAGLRGDAAMNNRKSALEDWKARVKVLLDQAVGTANRGPSRAEVLLKATGGPYVMKGGKPLLLSTITAEFPASRSKPPPAPPSTIHHLAGSHPTGPRIDIRLTVDGRFEVDAKGWVSRRGPFSPEQFGENEIERLVEDFVSKCSANRKAPSLPTGRPSAARAMPNKEGTGTIATWRAEFYSNRDDMNPSRGIVFEAKDETEAADIAANAMGTSEIRVDVIRTVLKK